MCLDLMCSMKESSISVELPSNLHLFQRHFTFALSAVGLLLLFAAVVGNELVDIEVGFDAVGVGGGSIMHISWLL